MARCGRREGRGGPRRAGIRARSSMVFNGGAAPRAHMGSQEYKHIVRIVGSDIPGEKKILIGLTQVRGVGYNFATAVLDSLGISPDANIGYLSDAQVASIEKVLRDPGAAGFPAWFLNRRKDVATGKDMHLLTSDIEFTVRNDVERERASGSWRGFRHMFGLKVRGQRTRTTGRKGGAVGVAKGGKVMPAKGGPAQAPAADAAPAAEAAAPAAAEK